ncbi:MAG: HPr kinase/phosphorylase [Alphaproteobacteria bacterium]
MSDTAEKVHGSCVEVEGLGVLLCGAPGSGKSDLTLRLVDDGARLIADDYTQLTQENGRLFASAPDTIKGLLEVRGVGVLDIGAALRVELGVVIDLVDTDAVERLPDDRTTEISGVQVPHFSLAAFEASAPAKVRLITRRVKGDIKHVP